MSSHMIFKILIWILDNFLSQFNVIITAFKLNCIWI